MSCRKCWSDTATADRHGVAYTELVERRDAEGRTCTPEEQAGLSATECPECRRVTIHEIIGHCTACGLEPT